MDESRYTEERLGELLRLLPPAPAGWVRAAQELPRARAELGSIVARAEADAAYRARVVADLEAALAAEGVEPTAVRIAALRARLSPDA
jgi:hypothetical protein